MKKLKLNFKKPLRFSGVGVALKYMMGSRIKFHTVNVTKAATAAGNRSADPHVAIRSAALGYDGDKNMDPASRKALAVSMIQLHPVYEM
mmetsp:Transcript_44813/g.136848  ORF Transcript_44813/g.136848 Transcript_44813/m.136848 type:complete len:89 (-) Transcript_44813:688-954(-)